MTNTSIMKNIIPIISLAFISINGSAQCDTVKHEETFKNGSYVNGFLACGKKSG
jgi:hypothetical protein